MRLRCLRASARYKPHKQDKPHLAHKQSTQQRSDFSWLANFLSQVCAASARTRHPAFLPQKGRIAKRTPDKAAAFMENVGCAAANVGCAAMNVGCVGANVGCAVTNVGCAVMNVGCASVAHGRKRAAHRCAVVAHGCKMVMRGCVMERTQAKRRVALCVVVQVSRECRELSPRLRPARHVREEATAL